MHRLVTTDWEHRFDEMRRRSAERRAAIIAEHGLSDDVRCLSCGDTGRTFGIATPCHCEAGELEIRRDRRAEDWRYSIPPRLQGSRLDTCPNGELAKRVGLWVETLAPLGTNLVVTGGVGRGKTGAAIGALRRLHDEGRSVGYWSAPSLLDQLRRDEFDRGGASPTMANAIRVDALLLDDVGSERITDYAAERLQVLVNERHLASRPTLLTSNLDGPALASHLGERITSRLKQACVSIDATGPDLRLGGRAA